MELLRYLFGFDGRIGRAHLWVGLIFTIVISSILHRLTPLGERVLGEVIGTIIFDAIGLILCAAFVSLEARRLHDRNKSAWWLMLQTLPFLHVVTFGLLVSRYADPIDHERIALVIYWMIWTSIPLWIIVLWFFMQLFCLRGTAGPNRFGPDPLSVEGGGVQLKPARD